MDELIYSVSDFVAVFNQIVSYAYPSVIIEGEIDSFRISKNRFVYFDIKDADSSVKCFAIIYQIPGPLEDGLMVRIKGSPQLHQRYGFSVNITSIMPVGEGSLKRAAQLLESKLTKEGLFDPSRKRILPYPPQKVGLVTSTESAAYHDFIKILNERWSGLEILVYDSLVQGDMAAEQVEAGLTFFNTSSEVDVVVITRGGGSAQDLAAFNDERLVRAVGLSRIPTLVAIGHEVDISLAEKAADQRASTPSNAAELLTPDKKHILKQLEGMNYQLKQSVSNYLESLLTSTKLMKQSLLDSFDQLFKQTSFQLANKRDLLEALSPFKALTRGYAIVRKAGVVISSAKSLKVADELSIELTDSKLLSSVKSISSK
ncbi:MAG TPA: exodeoxyribonuclease VII large subunit [Candidatus Saccharimonadales bacterium]|nr:exodeoxyribonuclease VII large subunit [Candidatus Saccharimonadales bacterium]